MATPVTWAVTAGETTELGDGTRRSGQLEREMRLFTDSHEPCSMSNQRTSSTPRKQSHLLPSAPLHLLIGLSPSHWLSGAYRAKLWRQLVKEAITWCPYKGRVNFAALPFF